MHKQVNVFLHNCANAIWSFKGLEGPPLFILVIFLCQKISITLQRMQTSSILSRVIMIGLLLFDFHPFTTHLDQPIIKVDC
jgi:hypothetical protein